ncbi:precorrin-6y C5,15-methyltransferase (decarboxylating) subunit CbiE [Tateyamaria sp. SN6-1]|uniref:precorrin-6y C5,15-methyltransferase (decarboxylating) subunit CbiE n=1 Tax=Tateyamaria sp. SN6-1 TaxID=3092148 RepID=UPI0039F4E392
MSDPWLTIVGIGEDGVAGLTARSQAALAAAEVIMAPPRHLAMIPEAAAERIAWPVPFADGIAILASLRGQKVVVLASGDPFWFGAGSVIARSFGADEWTALPGPSCFSLAAAQLGWALEASDCIALHAAPFARLRRHLSPGARIIATLRDGDAVAGICAFLSDAGFGPSRVTILERLGGVDEFITTAKADAVTGNFAHPLVIAIEAAGTGPALTVATGQCDDSFDHDGQITKRPVRAITLSTLAPRPHEHLWDIGGGSGSIGLEWALAHPTLRTTTVEPRTDRAARIRHNAEQLGVADRVTVIEGAAPGTLPDTGTPDAIFVGGGLSQDLLDAITAIPARIVMNAVTLEGEALLAAAQAAHGGTLMRIDLSHATPLGPKRGWSASYPVVQWSLTR